jgi:hypothetical protein
MGAPGWGIRTTRLRNLPEMAEVEEARSIASSTSAVSSPTTVAAMTSTVEPAPAVSAVVVVAAVSVGAVVAARGFVFVVPTATTRAKGDANDHNYSHYDRNYKKRSHSDSPLLGFPESMPDSTLVWSMHTTWGTFWVGLRFGRV